MLFCDERQKKKKKNEMRIVKMLNREDRKILKREKIGKIRTIRIPQKEIKKNKIKGVISKKSNLNNNKIFEFELLIVNVNKEKGCRI